LALPRFREGRLSTDLIAEEFPKGFTGAIPDAAALRHLAGVAAALNRTLVERDRRIEGQLPGRQWRPSEAWVVRLSGAGAEKVLRATIAPTAGGWDITVDGQVVAVRGDCTPGLGLFDGTVNGDPVAVRLRRRGIRWRLSQGGLTIDALVVTERGSSYLDLMPVKAAPDLSRFLLSPMPGLLVSIAVREGQEVKAGEPLAVVEAMKMENVLKAARDGRVAHLHAKPGDSLAVDQKILELA
jgi:propionyl-CoA carboxylase alpha chain